MMPKNCQCEDILCVFSSLTVYGALRRIVLTRTHSAVLLPATHTFTHTNIQSPPHHDSHVIKAITVKQLLGAESTPVNFSPE